MGRTLVGTRDGLAGPLGNNGYMPLYTAPQIGRKSREFSERDLVPMRNGTSKKADHESQPAQLDKPMHPVHPNGDAKNLDPEDEEPQPILLMVSEPGKPSCKEPVASDHLELSWIQSVRTATVGELEPGLTVPEIDVGYSVEVQEVRTSLGRTRYWTPC